MKKRVKLFFFVLASLLCCQIGNSQNSQTSRPKQNRSLPKTKINLQKNNESEWIKLGIGKYRDDIITAKFVVESYEFEVEVEENREHPGRYRIHNPYKNYPISPSPESFNEYLEIDATHPDQVFFKKYNTGMVWEEGGAIYINSIAGDYHEKDQFEQAIEEGLCGTLKNKTITFPELSLLYFDEEMDKNTQGLKANKTGLFRIKLPGAPDTDVIIKIKEVVEKDGKSFIAVDFSLEKDIEKIKVAMFEGKYADSLAEAIKNDAVAIMELRKSGELLFPYEEDGVYTFVALPYYAGESIPPVYLTKELSFLHKGWKEIGTAKYTDGYLSDCELPMGISVETTLVEIQESTEYPGLYRLVDPYGLNYKYTTTQNYDTEHRYYMEIDARDTERVLVKKMEKGCGLKINVGKMILWSRADRAISDGKTSEEVDKMGLYGKKEGKYISFPKAALCINFPEVPYKQNTWYQANLNGNFRVELPDATAVEIPQTYTPSNMESPEYYTLDGLKVSKEALQNGIYIQKIGSTYSKVIIRR